MTGIYLDNNATTKPHPLVVESMEPYFSDLYGNPASSHQVGRRALKAVDQARSQVAKLLGCNSKEIFFTSGGTESNNTAILGVINHYLRSSRDKIRCIPESHFITSQIEHPSVLNTFQQLEHFGAKVSYLPVNKQGHILVEQLEEIIQSGTLLISLMHGNNEVGSLQPIDQMAHIAQKHNILFHTDAVQTVGKIPLHLPSLGVDLLSLSAHKFHGPKGVGVLYIKQGTPIHALLYGGAQEKRMRPGTLNVPAIVGLGKACELAETFLSSLEHRTISILRKDFVTGLMEFYPEIIQNGPTENCLEHTLNLSFPTHSAEELMITLDMQGISASLGSACSSGVSTLSHVLTAMDLPEKQIRSSIRFSFSRFTTEEEIKRTLRVLKKLLSK